MTRSAASYVEAIVAIAVVTWLTSALLPVLGVASAALLFLLPVLLAASRGGVGPGLVSALGGAAAYNYFLLEPRFTFRVHQLDNLISVFMLGAVAVVTSRLATRLMAREAEANARALASDEAAELSAILAAGTPQDALANGLSFLAARYGEVKLIEPCVSVPDDGALSSLDSSAAAWAQHNGDLTGHGTETMAAADWTFVPLVPKSRQEVAIAAIARPSDGSARSAQDIAQLQQLGLLLGQCLDRVRLDAERRERETLEQSERLRRTFLASLAHDFRTPLTVIRGQLELLSHFHGEAREALAAAQRLDRTMSDLIGAAQIEEGSLRAAIESVDLVDAVSACCDDLALPDGVTLTRRIAADLPFVSADPVLLHRTIANLLDNALRHARAAVVVSAVVRAGQLALTVEDDGMGIPPDQRERVFERFVRLEGSDSGEGSGLGLAIVRGFAEAMGASVSVAESELGGAAFVLSMPLAEGVHA